MRKAVVSVVLALCCCFLFAGKFWEDKPYPEWKAKDVERMLVKSPWAQSQTISVALSSGRGRDLTSRPSSAGEGGPSITAPLPGDDISSSRSNQRRMTDYMISKQYLVRFQSARPIRMAQAQFSLLNGNATPEQAETHVETDPGDGDIVVVLGVAAGQDWSELEAATTDVLRNETYLFVNPGKRRIYLKQYLTPAEVGGVEGVFIFPRVQDGNVALTAQDKQVRFVTKLSSQTKLNRGFKIKDMIFNGKLEL